MAARIPNYQGAPDGVHLYTPGAMWNLLLWKKTQVISAIYSFIGAHVLCLFTRVLRFVMNELLFPPKFQYVV